MNLRKLDVARQPLEDATPVGALRNLTNLKIYGCPGLKRIDFAVNLNGLESLDIHKTNVSDLEPLRNLTDLTVLLLSENDALRDLAPLKGLRKLKYLDVEKCKNLQKQQIEALKQALPELKIGTD